MNSQQDSLNIHCCTWMLRQQQLKMTANSWRTIIFASAIGLHRRKKEWLLNVLFTYKTGRLVCQIWREHRSGGCFLQGLVGKLVKFPHKKKSTLFWLTQGHIFNQSILNFSTNYSINTLLQLLSSTLSMCK